MDQLEPENLNNEQVQNKPTKKTSEYWNFFTI